MAAEKLNQGQQPNIDISVENVIKQVQNVVDVALKEPKKDNALGNSKNVGMLKVDGNNKSVGENIKGLPMCELISDPLMAAAEAHQQLAASAWDCYRRTVFYDKSDNGHQEGETGIVEFKVNRSIKQNGQVIMEEQTVRVPFIGLVPIPSLLVDRVDVDFQMEVTYTETNNSNLSSDVSTGISSAGSSDLKSVER